MLATRPPNSRTLSARSEVEVLESPPLSASSSSTTSTINDDQDIMTVDDLPEESTEVVLQQEEEEERRGRTPTQGFEMDPRDMSPRRNSEELDQLGAETKARLEYQARILQSGLLALLDRVDKVREEHEKLEGENRFLQEYIGSLMATSKITGSGPRGRNSGGRLK